MQQPVMSSSRSNDVTDVHKILDKSCSRLENFIVTGAFLYLDFLTQFTERQQIYFPNKNLILFHLCTYCGYLNLNNSNVISEFFRFPLSMYIVSTIVCRHRNKIHTMWGVWTVPHIGGTSASSESARHNYPAL